MASRRRILPPERAAGSTDRAKATRSWRGNGRVKFVSAPDRRSQSWKLDRGFRERKRMPRVSNPDWENLEVLPATSRAAPDKYNHTSPRLRIPAGNPSHRNSRLRFGQSGQRSQRDASHHSRVLRDRHLLAHESEPSLFPDVRFLRITRSIARPLQLAPRGRSHL